MIYIEKSTACGTVHSPPSKSMAHRALICAGLAKGRSIISNIEYSKDILATIGCLEALGVKCIKHEHSVEVDGGIDISGKTEISLYANESGSTLRFFIPICLTLGIKCTFEGAPSLMSRPLEIYESICKEEGFLYEKSGNFLTVCGKLSKNCYTISGSISSQFISGLMFALPLTGRSCKICVTDNFESKPYVDMTVLCQTGFCVDTKRIGNEIFISGSGAYTAQDYTVEGDWSNSAFFDAFNLIGGNVTVTGLLDSSLQGDKIYRDFYEIFKTNPEKADFNIADCPDLAPVLMAMGAYYGYCRLTGTKRLKIKESDRGAVMALELEKFGIKTELGENELTVRGKLTPPAEILFSHNDHRIAMALSLLLSKTGGKLDDEKSVSKSLPDFFERIKSLGIGVKPCDL